jgi:hypothetical protein
MIFSRDPPKMTLLYNFYSFSLHRIKWKMYKKFWQSINREFLSCPDVNSDGQGGVFWQTANNSKKIDRNAKFWEGFRWFKLNKQFENYKYILFFIQPKITFFRVFLLELKVVYLYMQVLNMYEPYVHILQIRFLPKTYNKL